MTQKNKKLPAMLPKSEDWMNLVLVKPPSMTDEECGDLKAFVGQDHGPDPAELETRKAYYDVQTLENGLAPFYLVGYTCSKEDLEALNAGRSLYIKIMAPHFPPVAVFTCDEAGNIN